MSPCTHTHTTLNALKSPQSPQQPCSVSLSPKPLAETPGKHGERPPVSGVFLNHVTAIRSGFNATVLLSQRRGDVLICFRWIITFIFVLDTVMFTLYRRPECVRPSACACVRACVHVNRGVRGNDSLIFFFFKITRRIPKRSKTCGVGRRESWELRCQC